MHIDLANLVLLILDMWLLSPLTDIPTENFYCLFQGPKDMYSINVLK